MTRAMKPGDVVETPHGRGWLLYPVLKTQRREWMVLIGTPPRAHQVSVDEMLGTSQDVPRICPQSGEHGTRSENMSTAGTYQQEMKL